MDVPSLMRQSLRFNRDRVALITQDRVLSYAEAWDRGVRLSNALINLGIEPGDRVGMVEDNSLAAADLIIGAAIAGAVRVPLYARNSRDAHKAMIASTGTRLVFADPHYFSSVEGLESEIDCLQETINRDDRYEDWLSTQNDRDPMVMVGPDDWYIIRHSSGTSGEPKGVGYRQHSWVVNCRNWFYRLPRLTESSVVGHAAPISHAAGYLFLPTWLHGAANLLYGGFDPPKVLELTEQHRVSHTFLAPSMVVSLTNHPSAGTRDWSSLECILTGGAPITDATIAASRRVFGDVLYQVFGQTEATPLTILTPQEWFHDVPGSTPLRSAGKVMPFARIDIRGLDGKPVPHGDDGEIYTRVESQMEGYWGNPALSATRLVGGWVRTGDIGKLDDNGYLYVLDRVDDMIVSGAFNIWPSELETVISDHPEVREVAVFGIPDQRWGETPLALCVIDEGTTVTQQDIIDVVVQRMGSYMKPSRVEFTHQALPKTVVGKLNRKVLREPYWVGHNRKVGGA